MHEIARQLRRGALRSATAMIGTVVCLTGAYCYACPPPDESAGPRRVRAIPDVVWAAPGAEFIVRARVLDESGNALPESDLAELRWTSDLPAFTATNGPVAKVQAPTGAPTNFSLQAKFEDAEPASVSVHVTGASAPLEMDWVAAKHARDGPPALVLVDARRIEAVSDTLIAIAERGALDYFTCPTTEPNCGEVTLFSPSQSVYRLTALDFTGSCQAVQLAGHAGFPVTCDTTLRDAAGPRSVPATKIYILASDAGLGSADFSGGEAPVVDPVEVAEDDLTYAQRVLAEGWTGLSLTPPVKRIDGSEIDITLGEGNSCTSGEKTVKQQLVEANVPEAEMKGATITIAYVGRLLDPRGIELSGMRGATCPWSEDTGSIVLISWAQRLPTTLAHEFMHAIGPWQSHPWGHTDGVPGLNSQNILWGGEDPTTRTPRFYVTLGQAFRFSLDANSIFNRSAVRLSSEPSFVCQSITSTEESPCPRLTKDVIRP